MPEPLSAVSTDGILYTWLYKPLSKQLCILDPNWITIACFFMLAPIIWGLHKQWSLSTLLTLMFVRQSMDCLDGAVARSCDKKSKMGAFLDVAEDTATVVFLGGYVAWRLIDKRSVDPMLKWIIGGLWVAAVAVFGYNTVATADGTAGFWPALLHDNTVILSLLTIWIIHSII
jgi:phosphatidylglycerophosphate synthase